MQCTHNCQCLYIRAGSGLLASVIPRFVHRTTRWWSVTHHSRERISTAPECNGGDALHHSSRRFALHMVILGLCVAARPWKTISWSFRRTVLVLMLLPEAVCDLVVSVATVDSWFLHASALGSPILWACVAYHFVAEPLLPNPLIWSGVHILLYILYSVSDMALKLHIGECARPHWVVVAY